VHFTQAQLGKKTLPTYVLLRYTILYTCEDK